MRLKAMKSHIFSAYYDRFCAHISFRFEISLTLLARLLHCSVMADMHLVPELRVPITLEHLDEIS